MQHFRTRTESSSCIFVLIVLLVVVMIVQAHPQSFNCDGPKWKPNAPFGHMLVEKLTAVKHASECRIEGAPKRFHPGRKYPIKVYSEAALGHKLTVDQGRLIPDRAKAFEAESKLQTPTCGYRYKQKLSAYIWVAPSKQTKTVGFYALCGQFIGPIYIAQPVVSTLKWSSSVEEEGLVSDDYDDLARNDGENPVEGRTAALYL